jgi:transcriptional regulator GlxA family with amidase domain
MSASHEKISIEAVALRVGFSSASHFSKAFKSRFGFAPGKLKKDQQRIGSHMKWSQKART